MCEHVSIFPRTVLYRGRKIPVFKTGRAKIASKFGNTGIFGGTGAGFETVGPVSLNGYGRRLNII